MTNNTRPDNTFSMVPHWLLEANVSGNAIYLYAVLMKYADNDTREAFPSRARLASDLSKSVDTIDRLAKELCALGALQITRRSRPNSQESYPNTYTLITKNPSEVAAPMRPPSRTHAALTRPTELDPLNTSFTSDESDEEKSCTSEQSSDAKNPGNLSRTQRTQLIRSLQAVGQLLQAGHKFYDEDPYYAWAMFTDQLSQAFPEKFDEYFADLLHNEKWTVSAKVADPYQAGIELNKIINTGATL